MSSTHAPDVPGWKTVDTGRDTVVDCWEHPSGVRIFVEERGDSLVSDIETMPNAPNALNVDLIRRTLPDPVTITDQEVKDRLVKSEEGRGVPTISRDEARKQVREEKEHIIVQKTQNWMVGSNLPLGN